MGQIMQPYGVTIYGNHYAVEDIKDCHLNRVLKRWMKRQSSRFSIFVSWWKYTFTGIKQGIISLVQFNVCWINLSGNIEKMLPYYPTFFYNFPKSSGFFRFFSKLIQAVAII